MRDLFGHEDEPPPARAFGGETYDPDRDHERLSRQLRAVYKLMSDGQWRTLRQISEQIEGRGTEASVSARLRDLRKQQYGGHTVERESAGGGLFRYRLRASALLEEARQQAALHDAWELRRRDKAAR